MHKAIITAAAAATICLLLAGCASDRSHDISYKQATTLPPLEVPPDLTAPDTQDSDMPIPSGPTAGQAAAGQDSGAIGSTAAVGVLPQPGNVRVMRDGTMRWLVVQATPAQMWPRLLDFWKQQGLTVKRSDPATGIMETDWAVNRAELPQDFISKAISKVFSKAQGASSRDKYHLRLARGSQPDTTDIFLTQYKIGEVVISSTDGFNQTQWQAQPSDPAQVNEMLNRLLVFLGEPAKQAAALVSQAQQPAARAQLETGADGVPAVLVAEDFAQAWPRVGIALDHAGMVVDSEDRDKGIYEAHRVDMVADAHESDKGFFSGLFSSQNGQQAKPPQTRIVVQGQGGTTRVIVQDAAGKPDSSEQAKALLTQLTAELR